MSMNKRIIDLLKPIGVPVNLLTYSGTASTYITFFSLNERGSLFADDEEVQTDSSIQVDVWSKGDYTDLVRSVKVSLKEAGFTRTSEYEQYENDTKIFHKAIRFSFTSTPD